jgi:hypothetical protein
MKGLLFVCVTLAGCATASPQSQPPDSGGVVGGRPDSGATVDSKPPPDAAPLPDAPPGMQTVTLSETNNMTATTGAIACTVNDPIFGTVPIGTGDNQWYRIFKLSDFGISGAFNVQQVTFWIEDAEAGSGTTQPATIKIGTYSGTLEQDTISTGSITNITQQAITIPNGQGTNLATNINATVPAGSNLIVSVETPDGSGPGNFFYIGVSAGGETKKGYLGSTKCSVTTPKALTSAGGLNQPTNSVLLTVTGTK